MKDKLTLEEQIDQYSTDQQWSTCWGLGEAISEVKQVWWDDNYADDPERQQWLLSELKRKFGDPS